METKHLAANFISLGYSEQVAKILLEAGRGQTLYSKKNHSFHRSARHTLL